MENEQKRVKNCPKCKEEIDLNATICPHCRKKIGGTPTWIIVFCVIGGLILFGGIIGNIDTEDPNSNESSTTSPEKKEIEYTEVDIDELDLTESIDLSGGDIDELEDALDNNAAAAQEKYDGKYLAITGKLGTIDSDMKYISLNSLTDDWDLIGVHCTVKKSSTKDVIKTLSKGQTIVVKGKITDVGEVLGYYLDIDEIIPQ